MTTGIIIFAVIFLSILVFFIYTVKKRKKKSQASFFNPEDPVSRIFRHLDDV